MPAVPDTELQFAHRKISQAHDAVSDQILLIFRLKSRDLPVDGAERRLDELNADLRQWKEYMTLLRIRQGMVG